MYFFKIDDVHETRVTVFEWEKRGTGMLCLRRREAIFKRAPKARGVSMQLGGLGSAVSSPSWSGRSPATKRHLADFLPKMLYLARLSIQLRCPGERFKLSSGSGRSPVAKRDLVHCTVGLKM